MSLFDDLGGEPVLRSWIEDFVERVSADAMIGFFFREVDPGRLKEFEYQHVARLLGAPVAYRGRSIAEAHASHPIMDGHFDRRQQILRETLADRGVPAEVVREWISHNESLRPLVTRGECRRSGGGVGTQTMGTEREENEMEPSKETSKSSPELRIEVPLLDATEQRILGVLMEKQMATPDYYPMTLAALTSGCNQKSNRHPVTRFEEDEVLAALKRMMGGRGLIHTYQQSGSRVVRWEHRLAERLGLERPEKAILAELLLRGSQTEGELRGRAGRLFPFADLAVLRSSLESLEKRGLAYRLARQPGERGERFGHLLASAALREAAEARTESEPAGKPEPSSGLADRVERLEERVEALERELAALRGAVN